MLPIDTAIDQVRSRLQKAGVDEKNALESGLYIVLAEADRKDEALQLLDAAIAQRPDEVLSPFDGWPYHDHARWDEALELIDFALVRDVRNWRGRDGEQVGVEFCESEGDRAAGTLNLRNGPTVHLSAQNIRGMAAEIVSK